ncbi:DUF2059 domain-containing protein [Algihabitans sp.]|uniref:DUF2059 domain-containing protein n=1 Tax=Algihabitans sp. TaxID=2821514 RepID=UPI003BAB559A
MLRIPVSLSVIPFAFFAVFSAPSFGSQDIESKMEKARKVAELSGVVNMFFLHTKRIVGNDLRHYHEDLNREGSNIQNIMWEHILPEISDYKNMYIEDVADIHFDLFTEEELDSMIEFYQSHAGRRMMQSQYILIERFQEINLIHSSQINNKAVAVGLEWARDYFGNSVEEHRN